MDRQIKLIWDFRGPAAEHTAKHHHMHLDDFLKMNPLGINITGTEKVSDVHFLAYMVVEEKDMKAIRDRLKPHRGQIYKD